MRYWRMTIGHNTLSVRRSHGAVIFGGLCTRWDLAGDANCCHLGAKWWDGTKPGLWTHGLDRGLDYGLDHGPKIDSILGM